VRVRNSGQVVIRLETNDDVPAIHDLTRRAFSGKSYSDGTEPDLIDQLRAKGALALSLVAERDNTIIGHAALSPAFAEDGSGGWYALGPISVEPSSQKTGVGTALIQEAMTRLARLNARGCIVLGDTNYYPRHGFVPRPDLAPKGEPAEHFMIRSMIDDLPDTVVSFHPVLQTPGTP
jgi:putative acetyltransferase